MVRITRRRTRRRTRSRGGKRTKRRTRRRRGGKPTLKRQNASRNLSKDQLVREIAQAEIVKRKMQEGERANWEHQMKNPKKTLAESKKEWIKQHINPDTIGPSLTDDEMVFRNPDSEGRAQLGDPPKQKGGKRKLNAYFKTMLAAKRKGLGSFKYKGKTYKGRKHARLGMIYKRAK